MGYSPWGHKESDATEHACVHVELMLWKVPLVSRYPALGWGQCPGLGVGVKGSGALFLAPSSEHL